MKIRRAVIEDIPFLGWVMLTAARSHLSRSPWSVIFDEPESRTRMLLERMCRVSVRHWSHFSRYWVAEIKGRPAAAMCGFAPASVGPLSLAETEIGIAKQTFGYSDERLAEIRERLRIATRGMPDDLPDVWAIENVAVLPECRGKGLIDALFKQILDEGRQLGFRRAQILCLIGNEHAQQAFERNGFKVLSQRTSPAFNTLFGTPGARLLFRDL